jgi:putative pyruvate formate lyase activating enzyme
MPSQYPSYLDLLASGELARRAASAVQGLAECVGCARQCRADRLHPGQRKPFCRTGRLAWVSSYFPHHGEEACLRGIHGSGTIFFSQCNLRCLFCQNYEISWQAAGCAVEPDELARMMLDLQARGCHNINLVTPSHVVPQILEALVLAAEGGLRLPIVYNTGGYDSLETLRLLEGVVDIYMPDYKFSDAQTARELAKAEDYPEVVRRAIREMHRQVGDLVVDEAGVARRGLLVRHLVMPNGKAGTREAMRFLAREVSPNTFVNIMRQYRPEGEARRLPPIDRPITAAEWLDAVRIARQEGLWRFDRDA